MKQGHTKGTDSGRKGGNARKYKWILIQKKNGIISICKSSSNYQKDKYIQCPESYFICEIRCNHENLFLIHLLDVNSPKKNSDDKPHPKIRSDKDTSNAKQSKKNLKRKECAEDTSCKIPDKKKRSEF